MKIIAQAQHRKVPLSIVIGLLACASILAFLILSLQFSPKSYAVDANTFQAGNIITDPVFTDTNSMSTAQIQSFLDSKVPNCDTNGTQPASEYGRSDLTHAEYAASRGWQSPPYTCLKNYTKTTSTVTICGESIPGKSNKSAAEIIYDTSQACDINPQVLIVLLQKEQSLITDTWPLNNPQYKSATGYGCPDDAACDSQYYGFVNQVQWAARMFRAIMDDSPTWYTPYELGNNFIYYSPNSSCGGSTVNIKNRATQALYNYTPYQPNTASLNAGYGNAAGDCDSHGNRNFFLYFSDWFGSTQRVNNVRLITCGDDQYLVERGIDRKRLLTDAAISAWEFPDEYFLTGDPGCDYPTYTVVLDRVMRSRDSKKVYLVDNGKAYNVNSQAVADAWGLGNALTSDYPQLDSQSILDNLSTGHILSRIVTSDNPDRLDTYLVDDSERHEITGTDTGDDRSLRLIKGYDDSPVQTLSVSVLQTLTNTEQVDFSFQVGEDWYLLDHAKLKRVEDPSTWIGILDGPVLSPAALSLFSNQSELGGGFQRNGQYYKLDGSSDLERTPDQPIAKLWDVYSEPVITQLLTNKVVAASTSLTDVSTLNGNIRLIQCGEDKYLVERYIKVKRSITNTGLTEWGIADKYFFAEDKGCSYPTYSLAADQLIRSRTSNKVYYIEDGKAYYVHSAEAANDWGFGDTSTQTYPQFEGVSINDTFEVIKRLPPAS